LSRLIEARSPITLLRDGMMREAKIRDLKTQEKVKIK
jgi:hypothetical protein